jgi:sphinganine-1-phosphate aldolase
VCVCFLFLSIEHILSSTFIMEVLDRVLVQAQQYWSLAATHTNKHLQDYDKLSVVVLTLASLVCIRFVNSFFSYFAKHGKFVVAFCLSVCLSVRLSVCVCIVCRLSLCVCVCVCALTTHILTLPLSLPFSHSLPPGLKGGITLAVLRIVKLLPGGASKIAAENEKLVAKMEKDVIGKFDQGIHRYKLPQKGMSHGDVIKQLEEWQVTEEKQWRTGQVSGAVYHGGEKLQGLINKAYGMFSLANPLHADVFPYTRKMEAECISWSVNLFQGDETCCGSFTSGGTESLLMAVRTYREKALHERGITEPELVLPITAHPAFDKAADYFRVKLVHVPVDQKTFAVNPRDMERAITRNTIALVGSAPAFPQGCMDPIEAIAAIAQKHNLGMHVDSCLGGFLLPFMRLNKRPLPKFDFSVPGVTSISADLHKFGFASKGCSVVMYRSHELRRYQYFVQPNWPGGIYASPAIAGSRAGGLVAGCWAAMMSLGIEGYLAEAKAIIDTADTIREGINTIPDVQIMGNPEMSVLAFSSKTVEILKIGEGMSKRGWNLNFLQNPASFHICVTRMHVGNAEKFLQDLRDSVQHVKDKPEDFNDGAAAMYGMAGTIPDRSIIRSFAASYIDILYKV